MLFSLCNGFLIDLMAIISNVTMWPNSNFQLMIANGEMANLAT